jgi:hypothetical protein
MNLRKNLTTLSVEVILALLGFGLCIWYLIDYVIGYVKANCTFNIDNASNDVRTDCQGAAFHIALLVILAVLSLIMLAWGVSC